MTHPTHEQFTSDYKEIDILRPADRLTATGTREFQRAYKACLSCRQKKARCVLASGVNGKGEDQILGPPCARCRREQRQCVFSEKRSWARKRNSTVDAEGKGCDEVDTYQEKRRRTVNTDSDGSSQMSKGHDKTHYRQESYQDLSGLGSRDDNQQHSPETTHSYITERTPSQMSPSAATSTSGGLGSSMMRTVVSSGNDALNLLFEAAHHHSREGGDDLMMVIKGDAEEVHRRTRVDYSQSLPQHGTRGYGGFHRNRGPSAGAARSIGTSPAAPPPVTISSSSKEILEVWQSYRFVKLGWLTAQEALSYVDLWVYRFSLRLKPMFMLTRRLTDSSKISLLCHQFLVIFTLNIGTTTC